jgi:heptose I phosphotransferase
MQELKLNPELQKYFAKETSPFAAIIALKGEIFRSVKGRETLRVVLNGRAYFIKKHLGVSCKELLKNLIQLKLPILSAKNEKKAIEKLHSIGIPTMTLAGYGESGFNPLRRQSFLITEELTGAVSMEDVANSWLKTPPSFALKQEYIHKIATIARILHNSGLNHRDFYICHFLLDSTKQNLYLIDLHRMQIREKTSAKWRIKDLAALYFSVMGFEITKHDLLRFIGYYFDQPWSEAITQHKALLRKIEVRAKKLYSKHFDPMRNFAESWVTKKNWSHYSVCNLAYCDESMQSLLESPDRYMAKGELLMGEDVNSVVKINLAGRELVIKRYNNRGFLFAIKRALVKSRAKKCWYSAHKLLALKILTPKPVAFLENRFGPLHGRSYYISEFVKGSHLKNFLLSNINSGDKLRVIKALIKILNDLRQAAIRHGDTKPSNFIVFKEEVYITDLDSMVQHLSWYYNLSSAFTKDRNRLLRAWQQHPEILKMFLAEYGL